MATPRRHPKLTLTANDWCRTHDFNVISCKVEDMVWTGNQIVII
jgi:hypothetical protein